MHQRVNILGVGVSAIDMALALDAIDGWIEDRSATFVCIRDVHGIMASQHDEAYRAIHSRAGMVTPDGMPVVWAARMMGYRGVRKVSGTDLMAAVCERSISRGHRHFLYGGAVRLPQNSHILGLIGGTAQWLFQRGDILSVTISDAGALVTAPGASPGATAVFEIPR